MFLFFKSSPWLKKAICACEVKGSCDSIMTPLCGCEPSTQSGCVFLSFPLLPLKCLKPPVSYLPRLQSRWVDHGRRGGDKLRCCWSWDKATDHMELESFQNTQPVSFKLASQKQPRRWGQVKVVVKGGLPVRRLFPLAFPPRTSWRLLSLSKKTAIYPRTLAQNHFRCLQ